MRMDDVLALLERQDMGDQEMVDYLAHALQEPASPRPSIETLLHGFLPATAVIHTHADAVVSLTNNDRSRDVLREVYGEEVIPLSYRRPGFLISREVAQTFEAHPKARALLLEKHGTICWGATVKEAYLATIELISRAEEAIAHRARGRARFGGVALASPPPEERRRVALAVAPHLRGLVGRDRRQVLFFDDAPDVLEFAGSREAEALCQIGPATPDHTIFTKRLPCFAPVENPADPESVRAGVTKAVERFVADYTAYFEAHNTGGAKLTDPFPRVVVVGGLGLFATGKDRRTAGIVDDIYHHTISVLGAATSFGELRLAHRQGRLRRRVLAARALQALAGPAREGAGPAHRAGHRGRQRHRARGGPAAGRRGRARGGGRPGRGGRAQGGRGDRGRRGRGPGGGARHGRDQRGLGARRLRDRRC